GKTMPDLSNLEKIAEKLDTDISVLLYGDKTLKGYTSNQVAKIIMYWAVLILISVSAEFLSYHMLGRVSEYAGYTILIEYKTYAFAAFFYSFVFLFIWVILWRMSNLADRYGNLFKKTVVSVSIMLAVLTVGFMTFSATRHCIYTYNRFEHVILKGNDRYRIEDVDNIYGLYSHHDMGWSGGSQNRIIYIDSDKENKTDDYLSDMVNRQPLKIERISEEKAVRFMNEYHIEKAPAVLIVRYENAEVLEGWEEISLLEWKIHNYKQHNIFFY
ncbi:MAG: hypothetical protein IJD80_06290, partial [Oscillospiraceae bacterium]|nr:hypothetical protein [Oscillospiraceae bacterium]